MNILKSRVAWGLALIALGVLFMLDTLGVFPLAGLVWAILFALGGLVFLYIFLTNREHWWAVIPGCTLFSLGVLIALSMLAPAADDVFGGAIFLGGIGLAFWIIYFNNREHWWAVIPGGVLFTLAAVTILSSFLEGEIAGAVFFLGLAFTFGVLSFLPTPEGRMRWARIPAFVLLVLGVVVAAAAGELAQFVWPAALILLGVYFIARAMGLFGRV